MATKLDNNTTVSFEEVLMSQVVKPEALTRLLVEKGIFTMEEFLEMVRLEGELGGLTLLLTLRRNEESLTRHSSGWLTAPADFCR